MAALACTPVQQVAIGYAGGIHCILPPLAKLKKGEAVAAAESLLHGTRWLPSRGPKTAWPDGSTLGIVCTRADDGRAYYRAEGPV